MPRLDKRLIMILWMVLVAVGSFNAQVYEPDQMVNPNVENRYKFVCDPAHLLDATTTDGVNRRLYDLRRTTTCEVAVIVVPSIGDTPIETGASRYSPAGASARATRATARCCS